MIRRAMCLLSFCSGRYCRIIVARTRTILSLNVRTSVGASCDPITLHVRSRPPNGCENGQCRSQREAESLPDACMSLQPAFLPVFSPHADIAVIRADAI